ncbi:MAG TPA: glycosyltransferase family 39 protein [Opitutaceae bacterium]|nr:glycosyltransferase family 39 protein [Opitutaceae bacterium]
MPAPPERGRLPLPWIAAGVLLLLSLYGYLALSASSRKGLSFDEGEQIAVGYDIWVRHDFRMEGANGDLIKRWSALPLLLSRPRLPGAHDPSWRSGYPYSVAYQFFFRSGNSPEELLRQARRMAVLFGLATGLLVFACSRRLFGDAGGLISLALFALSPHMLAFGGIVSTELSVCFTLLGATCCIWRLLHRVNIPRLLASLGFVALLFLAKLTALLIVPITAVLVAVRLARGGPLPWELGRRRAVSGRFRQLGVFSALVLLHAAAAWGAIWAAYGFRYAASPLPADPGVAFRRQNGADPVLPEVAGFVGWCRQAHFLPEGYLHGVKWLLGQNDRREAFMDGHWTVGGWASFFPYAIWAKTPPALLLLLPAGLAAWWFRRRRPPEPEGRPVPGLYAAAPYAALLAVYLGTAMAQKMNIGFRHILPIYPAVYVLAGSASLLGAGRRRWGRLALAALLLAYAASSAGIYPHYFAYFSPLVGGPRKGYRRLVDGSLDWGMDLPGLKRWLDRNDPRGEVPVFLNYFGTDSPEHYHINYHWLSAGYDWQRHAVSLMGPGIYAISATSFQGIGTLTFGRWNRTYEAQYQASFRYVQGMLQRARAAGRRLGGDVEPAVMARIRTFDGLCFGRLCAWLRHHREPDAEVGYSILVWRLSAQDLNAALLGPPPFAGGDGAALRRGS